MQDLVTAIQTIFKLDPEVKEESVTFAYGRRQPVVLMEHAGRHLSHGAVVIGVGALSAA